MNIALACVALAAVAPIICAGIAKAGRFGRGPGAFDNNNPREWLAKLTGYRARANAAQANSWEALIVFAPAVLAAQQAGVDAATVRTLTLAFVVARVAYVALYLADIASVRSLAWLVGFAASIALLLNAALA
jgi:uncharacterized MAPEG superfamily protein